MFKSYYLEGVEDVGVKQQQGNNQNNQNAYGCSTITWKM